MQVALFFTPGQPAVAAASEKAWTSSYHNVGSTPVLHLILNIKQPPIKKQHNEFFLVFLMLKDTLIMFIIVKTLSCVENLATLAHNVRESICQNFKCLKSVLRKGTKIMLHKHVCNDI